jgi:hypothetical protein
MYVVAELCSVMAKAWLGATASHKPYPLSDRESKNLE